MHPTMQKDGMVNFELSMSKNQNFRRQTGFESLSW